MGDSYFFEYCLVSHESLKLLESLGYLEPEIGIFVIFECLIMAFRLFRASKSLFCDLETGNGLKLKISLIVIQSLIRLIGYLEPEYGF